MDYYSRRQRVWVVATIVGHGENLQSASLGPVCFSYSSQGPLFIEEGSEGVIVDVVEWDSLRHQLGRFCFLHLPRSHSPPLT